MEFLHVGLKVNDIHRSIETYKAFGMLWEPVKEYRHDTDTPDGGTQTVHTLVSHGLTADGTEIEMVQSLTGSVPDEIALGDREGFSHVAFRVDDLDEADQLAREAGLERVSYFSNDEVAYAFYRGEGLGGALAQLVQFKAPRSLDLPS